MFVNQSFKDGAVEMEKEDDEVDNSKQSAADADGQEGAAADSQIVKDEIKEGSGADAAGAAGATGDEEEKKDKDDASTKIIDDPTLITKNSVKDDMDDMNKKDNWEPTELTPVQKQIEKSDDFQPETFTMLAGKPEL